MNQVPLDGLAEAVQQFILHWRGESTGSVLLWQGKPVACLLPPPVIENLPNEPWTEAKNERRCALLNRKYHGPALALSEMVELAQLQEEMLRYREQVAPLPLEAARLLHQELLMAATPGAP